jgi:hypothetical protein
MMSREEEYRRLAQDCRRIAKTIQNHEVRAALEGMADAWDRLADQQRTSLHTDAAE